MEKNMKTDRVSEFRTKTRAQDSKPRTGPFNFGPLIGPNKTSEYLGQKLTKYGATVKQNFKFSTYDELLYSESFTMSHYHVPNRG